MDPLVQAALIAGFFGALGAWFTRPNRRQTRRLARIEAHTEKTGNGFAGHVLDSLEDIKTGQTHLVGRFDQHLNDSAAERAAAHKEALEMWAAITAVANANPPTRETDK